MQNQPFSIVFFAQVPPPEHGQSRMVLLGLETLRKDPHLFEVQHVNARFSNSLEDIGESSFGKLILTTRYLAQAIRLRYHLGLRETLLYYVPGPVKWSSVLRDWVLLGVLRRFYPNVVFHWHAIGHGEWAHGSKRLKLDGPRWMDRLARKMSAKILSQPFASITVSETSQNDSLAVSSIWKKVICNGLSDPCPNFVEKLAPLRLTRQQLLAKPTPPCFKVLFLSHGTLEKGTLDALDCLAAVLDRCNPSWTFQITFAGGISEALRLSFNSVASSLNLRWPGRIDIHEAGYITGIEKHQCFIEHDIFLAPSRWESFGLTVIEAMAYGMPIVATASDGVKGVLPEGYPYLGPVNNPLALAEILLQCCTDLNAYPRIQEGIALRDRFLERYQIKDFSKNLTHAFLDFAKEVTHEPTPHRFDSEQCVTELHRDATPQIIAISTNQSIEQRHTAVSIEPTIRITAYLADQNPGHDRSFGISRMSQVVLEALQAAEKVTIHTIASKTSQQAPASVTSTRVLPWGTRRKWERLLTDHFHPLFNWPKKEASLYYFPKGYLPLLSGFCHPSVVTIHDTIIQYDEDHYPEWRRPSEYRYWAMMLKHTLRNADRIMTVSESSKKQIQNFMIRHEIPPSKITVTYEPCLYERISQPVEPAKENYVIHLASCEPHKRTAHLIRWWHEAESQGRNLPMLHLIGTIPPEIESLLASSHSIVKSPFLEEAALQATYRSARALILPSEIEGFGLPALEAYYLGTPVCFVKGTSVEEILSVVTQQGGFDLETSESLFVALEEVMVMDPVQIYNYGLKLRDTYAAEKVASQMFAVFADVGRETITKPD